MQNSEVGVSQIPLTSEIDAQVERPNICIEKPDRSSLIKFWGTRITRPPYSSSGGHPMSPMSRFHSLHRLLDRDRSHRFPTTARREPE